MGIVRRTRYFLIPLVVLLFTGYCYFIGVARDITWMGLAVDSPDYVAASYFFEPAGLGGYPFYTTVGWIFTRIPANPYWSLGLLSAFSTILTSVLLFLLVYRLTGNVSLATAGMVVYPASFLVWTQSIIPEVYTFTTFLLVLGVYLAVTGRYVWCGVVLGLGLGTHLILLFSIPPIMYYIYRRVPDYLFLMVVGTLILLVGVATFLPFMAVGGGHSTIGGDMGDRIMFLLNSTGLFFSLPVVPTESTLVRLREFLPVFLLGPILLSTYSLFLKIREFQFSRQCLTPEVLLLGILCLVYILIYLTSFPPHWVVYLVPGLAFFVPFFLVLLWKLSPSGVSSWASHFVVVLGLGLVFYNLVWWNVGSTIDPSPTTARQFYSELESLPDNSIVYSFTWGHPHVLTSSYARFNDDRIVGMSGTFNWKVREYYCSEKGIVCPRSMIDGSIPLGYGLEVIDARQLQTLNPERPVYVAYIEDPHTLHFRLVPVHSYNTSLNTIFSGGSVSGW